MKISVLGTRGFPKIQGGVENKAGEINNLHPLMLLPDNLSSTSDSIYNEMTGKNVPIWQIQSMVTVDTDAPGWLALINTLLSFILIIFGIKAVPATDFQLHSIPLLPLHIYPPNTPEIVWNFSLFQYNKFRL